MPDNIPPQKTKHRTEVLRLSVVIWIVFLFLFNDITQLASSSYAFDSSMSTFTEDMKGIFLLDILLINVYSFIMIILSG